MKPTKKIPYALLAALLCLSLTACGSGDLTGADTGTTPSQSSTLYVKTGAVATDSWGYTGSTATQVAAPSQAEILLTERTLLMDPWKVVVTGISLTRVDFSCDAGNLPAAAQASAPQNFVSYVNIIVGTAYTALPSPSVTMDVGTASAGQTLTIYSYDPGTARWAAAQTAVVASNGKVAFQASHFGLWGLFR